MYFVANITICPDSGTTDSCCVLTAVTANTRTHYRYIYTLYDSQYVPRPMYLVPGVWVAGVSGSCLLCRISSRLCSCRMALHRPLLFVNRLEPRSGLGGKLPKIRLLCPQNGPAAVKSKSVGLQVERQPIAYRTKALQHSTLLRNSDVYGILSSCEGTLGA